MKSYRLISLLLILALFALGSCSKKASTPGDTVKEMMKRMEAGDISVSKLLAKDLAAMLGEEKLSQAVEEEAAKIKEKGGITSIVIDEELIDGETAKVKYTLTFGNGDTEKEDAELVMEDGSWKVTASK